MKTLLLLLVAPLVFAKSKTPSPPGNRTTWDVVIKTCDSANAGTDARVYLKISYQNDHTQEQFQLDTPAHNDFEQGQRDHYRVRPTQEDVINVGLYWWPSGTISEGWCVDWVVILDVEKKTCMVAEFHRWIRHYEDPPTYPQRLHKNLRMADCILPPTHTTKSANNLLSDVE